MKTDNWSEIWRRARANMPRSHERYMGSPTVLMTILGYKTEPKMNKAGELVPQSHGQHVYTSMSRGIKPRDPERQRLLKMLAGPHARAIVKAIAIQRGLDLSKYKVWPN